MVRDSLRKFYGSGRFIVSFNDFQKRAFEENDQQE